MITIVSAKRIVSYRSESGDYLEGDVHVLSEEPTIETTMDEYDIEEHGDEISAVVHYLRMKLFVTEPSVSPIGERVPDHAWLSGETDDSYGDMSKVEETTARVIGCTDRERAEIFRRVCDHAEDVL